VNSRWFYILIANVAVLSANIWLFIDKPQPEVTTIAPVIQPSPEPSVSPNVDFSPQPSPVPLQVSFLPFDPVYKQEEKIYASERFQFPLVEPLLTSEEKTTSQLQRAKAKINSKDNAIKKEQQKNRQQSKQLATLKQRNAQLLAELFALESELADREALVSTQKKKIEKLQQTTKEPSIFKSDIEMVKKAIDAPPDLFKQKKTDAEVISSADLSKEQLQNKVEIDRFSGSIEFGFSYEQDNQVTRAINGRLILDYDEPDTYHINSDLDFEFEDEDHQKTTEKLRWQLQSDYNLSPSNFIFARSDISRSRFASYEQEDIFTLGYGNIFFNNKTHKFNIEVGPGYRLAKPNVGKNAVSVDEFIVRTRLNYERVLSESLQVLVDTTLEAGLENSVYNLSFKAQNRIYQELYLIFNFDFKYNQNVPIDTVNDEISTGLSLLYAF
jgi:putative salt-induced outer membrane protein